MRMIKSEDLFFFTKITLRSQEKRERRSIEHIKSVYIEKSFQEVKRALEYDKQSKVNDLKM